MKRRKSQLLVGLGSAIMMAGAGAPGAAPALLAVRQPHGSNVEKRAKAIGVARSAAPDAAQTRDSAFREQPARLVLILRASRSPRPGSRGRPRPASSIRASSGRS